MIHSLPSQKKQTNPEKPRGGSRRKHTGLHGCTLYSTLHRCRSQRQYHRGENERVVCYASVSLVLLPVMHNECPRHALSIESEHKPTRVSLTWPPRLGPNSICVKPSTPLLCLQLGSKPPKHQKEGVRYSVWQHAKGMTEPFTKTQNSSSKNMHLAKLKWVGLSRISLKAFQVHISE